MKNIKLRYIILINIVLFIIVSQLLKIDAIFYIFFILGIIFTLYDIFSRYKKYSPYDWFITITILIVFIGLLIKRIYLNH